MDKKYINKAESKIQFVSKHSRLLFGNFFS